MPKKNFTAPASRWLLSPAVERGGLFFKNTMEREIWRDIPNWEGLYQASILGDVRGVLTGKILAKSVNNNGYDRVCLSRDGNSRKYLVHILVSKTFMPNPDNKPCVDHINGDRRDNRVENLRWCTQKENCNYENTRRKMSIAHSGEKALMFGKFGFEHNRSKSVCQLSMSGLLVGVFGSMAEAERNTGVKWTAISRVCRNKRRSAGGYIWKYANEEMEN